MSCYRTILVAYDGSADASAALQHATTLARDQHARLVLLTVMQVPPVQPADAASAGVARELEQAFGPSTAAPRGPSCAKATSQSC